MIITLGEDFLESIRKDIRLGKKPYIIFQNNKYKVIDIQDEPIGKNFGKNEYLVEIEMELD